MESGGHAVPVQPFAFSNGADRRRLSEVAAASEPEPCVLPSPLVLISEPERAWIMPVAGTFMRDRHAPKPAWIGRRRSRTGTANSACRRVFADRDMRPCDRFRPEIPARRIPDPSRNADPSPDCMAPPGIARPQPGGEQGRNCAEFPPMPRRRTSSAPPRGRRRRQHPATGGTAGGRTGRFRVTGPPQWTQAVVAPAVPETEFRLRNGVRPLADGGYDLRLPRQRRSPAAVRRRSWWWTTTRARSASCATRSPRPAMRRSSPATLA